MSKRTKFIRDCAIKSGSIALVSVISGLAAMRLLNGPEVPSWFYAAMAEGMLLGTAIWFVGALVWALLFADDACAWHNSRANRSKPGFNRRHYRGGGVLI